MKYKKGDTLIEVALAIGIFSMVAVAVVSVVSASTTDAQSSLETTVTREQIDTQAEALRFIQSSYLAGGYANAQGELLERYSQIWQYLTRDAVDPTEVSNTEVAEKILRFNPATCQEVYSGTNLRDQGAFVINTRLIGDNDADIKDVIVTARDNTDTGVFATSSTFPRIVYGSTTDLSVPDSTLDQTPTAANIYRVEGLFIVPVADPGTTIVSGADAAIEDRSAYYDFYIRSCWYNPGAERPSTISTVIRLQDPAAIDYGTDAAIAKRIIIRFDPNNPDYRSYMPTQSISSGATGTLRPNAYTVDGYNFAGWMLTPSGPDVAYADGSAYTAEEGLITNKSVTLYAKWIPKTSS